jgi:hypothetical protein
VLIAMVVAFYASARSLQLGPAIAVIIFTSLTGNIVALLGGILVFHDPIGHTPPQIAARIAAFGLVILGAALLPRTASRRRADVGRPPPPDPRPSDRDPAAGRDLSRAPVSKMRRRRTPANPRAHRWVSRPPPPCQTRRIGPARHGPRCRSAR